MKYVTLELKNTPSSGQIYGLMWVLDRLNIIKVESLSKQIKPVHHLGSLEVHEFHDISMSMVIDVGRS